MAAMAKRAEGRVEFAVKAHQDMTHFRDRYARALPRFREAIGPLREAGRLGCVLAQFPFSFKASPENVEFLRRVAGDLTPDPVVVEFRHGSWITEDTFRSPEGSWPRLLRRGRAAAAEPPPARRPRHRLPRLRALPRPEPREVVDPCGDLGTLRLSVHGGGALRVAAHASDPSPPEPRLASSSSTITPAARRSQMPPCWLPFSPAAPEVFVGIREPHPQSPLAPGLKV